MHYYIFTNFSFFLINFLAILFIVIFLSIIIVFIYASIKFLYSGENEEQRKIAKNMIRYSITGFVIFIVLIFLLHNILNFIDPNFSNYYSPGKILNKANELIKGFIKIFIKTNSERIIEFNEL